MYSGIGGFTGLSGVPAEAAATGGLSLTEGETAQEKRKAARYNQGRKNNLLSCISRI